MTLATVLRCDSWPPGQLPWRCTYLHAVCGEHDWTVEPNGEPILETNEIALDGQYVEMMGATSYVHRAGAEHQHACSGVIKA